jgi:ATP-binding cassette subfamily F protein 3
LKYGTNLEMRGRNGSGKSTFLRSIIYTYQNQGEYPSTVLEGSIKFNPKVRLGVYEQEVSSEYLDFTLSEMIGKFHNDLNLEFNNQELSRILSNYLFDPKVDKDLKLRDCSGGQKARVQIIKMLLNSPNLIILDEPTNHLDLPSVEELENMLKEFKGCIIYVTHDNYFRKNIGGEILTIGKK